MDQREYVISSNIMFLIIFMEANEKIQKSCGFLFVLCIDRSISSLDFGHVSACAHFSSNKKEVFLGFTKKYFLSLFAKRRIIPGLQCTQPFY